MPQLPHKFVNETLKKFDTRLCWTHFDHPSTSCHSHCHTHCRFTRNPDET